MPMLVLWGTRSGQGSGYDMLEVWRDHAEDVRGHGIDSGHFLPEEAAGRHLQRAAQLLRRRDLLTARGRHASRTPLGVLGDASGARL